MLYLMQVGTFLYSKGSLLTYDQFSAHQEFWYFLLSYFLAVCLLADIVSWVALPQICDFAHLFVEIK